MVNNNNYARELYANVIWTILEARNDGVNNAIVMFESTSENLLFANLLMLSLESRGYIVDISIPDSYIKIMWNRLNLDLYGN